MPGQWSEVPTFNSPLTGRPSLIADLRMPSMSGFEPLSLVRRRSPHIPPIAISGEFVLATMPLSFWRITSS
jgi:DNA-binding NtrC family response regulator